MKKNLLLFLFIFCVFSGNAQVGSVEVSTGGFSFIPAFTSKEPNVILNAGTNPSKKLTANFMLMTRIKSMTPNTFVIMTRYKLINRKFKTIVGVHIPALQISADYQTVTSFFGQEFTLSYPLSKKWNVGAFVLNGKGRNTDFKALFTALNAFHSADKWGFLSQVYYLDAGNLTGAAETITYDLNKKFQLKGFANYTVTDQSFIGTVGVKYTL